MIRSPIHKVLSLIPQHQVQALLMGGQACVFYGAVEFSRDIDLAFLAEPENLDRFGSFLAELQAACIAVPPFDVHYLERGHAVHFRCQHPEARGVRIDVMSKLRGLDPFQVLWDRRTTITDDDGVPYELMSLPDLVKAKKTQRDKDWPMIRRLMEVNYLAHSTRPTEEQVRFWLLEVRTPELLAALVQAQPASAQELSKTRPLLRYAIEDNPPALRAALVEEEEAERRVDQLYWTPLRKELEKLRRERSQND